jgi:hypothetical protein
MAGRPVDRVVLRAFFGYDEAQLLTLAEKPSGKELLSVRPVILQMRPNETVTVRLKRARPGPPRRN